MSLLLTGVTALFVKIFVHRNKEQNWLSAVPIKSHVFEELKREESLSHCLLFASGFLLGHPHHPTISLYFITFPTPSLFLSVSHRLFILLFLFFSSADFS